MSANSAGPPSGADDAGAGPPTPKGEHIAGEDYTGDRPVPQADLKRPRPGSRITDAGCGASASERAVFDPVTREHVSTRAATHADLLRAFEDVDRGGDAKPAGDAKAQRTMPDRRDGAGPGDGTADNVLLYPMPAVDLAGHRHQARRIFIAFAAFAALAALGATSVHPRLGPVLAAVLVATAGYVALQRHDASFDDAAWDAERRRGQEAIAKRLPESTEWLNQVIEQAWPLVDANIFAALMDQLEDIMQASVPALVESVKIVHIDQGRTPLRLLSMRALGGDKITEADSHEVSAKEPADLGSYANIEASFAYRAAPSSKRVKSKLQNARILLEFFIGTKSTSVVRFPVYAGLEGIVGTMRARLHLTPNFPYVNEVTVSLMGLPRIEISASPLLAAIPDVAKLPLLKQFIERSVDKALGEYTAPRSLTLDVADLLGGDGFPKRLDAFGVLLVRIHKAVGLAKSDRRGSSDPYVVLQFSRLGRPVFSTRVIVDDLSPSWEETAVILVNDDAVKADESIAAQLWDSDRTTPDDKLGYCEVALRDLIRRKGEIIKREDKLTSTAAGSDMPGTLHWDIVFYGLRDLRKDNPRKTDGADPRIPADMRQQEPELAAHGRAADPTHDTLWPVPPCVFVPPDPDYPSGVLHVSVLALDDVRYKSAKGTFGRRDELTVGQEAETDSHRDDEDDENVPSPYVTIFLNDGPIYRTRVKPLSASPVFSAGTERFVPDWRACNIMFSVRNRSVRESDGLLGVLPIRLADVLKNASFATQWWPISGGIASGKIRIGLLFRSLDTQLPRHLLGYDVGSLRVFSDVRITDFVDAEAKRELDGAKLILRTLGAKYVSRDCASSGDALVYRVSVPQPPLRLPLKRRDASSLLVEIHTKRTIRTKRFAVARTWVRHLDEEPTAVKLALYTMTDFDRYVQNHVDEAEHEQYGLRQIATVEVTVSFHSGLGDSHRASRFMRQPGQRELVDAWDAAMSAGLRLPPAFPQDPSNAPDEDDPSDDDDYDESERVQQGRKRAASETHGLQGMLSPLFAKSPSRSSHKSSNSNASEVSVERDREREKAQQRIEQRGIYTSKAVRTASWLKEGIKNGGLSIRHSLSHERAPDAIESETGPRGTLWQAQ